MRVMIAGFDRGGCIPINMGNVKITTKEECDVMMVESLVIGEVCLGGQTRGEHGGRAFC